MNKEESRRIFAEAMELSDKKQYSGALALLDTVEKEHPNSRHVNFHRAFCLLELGRVSEAKKCQDRLAGRIKPGDFQKLSQAIEKAQRSSGESDEEAFSDSESESVFTVQNVYPVSADECSVIGTVKSGVFHVNDTAYVVSRSGRQLPTPILRIGPADTPLLLARKGQQAMLLLKIGPNKISNGATIVCKTRPAVNKASTTDKSVASDPGIISKCPPELAPVEEMIKKGSYRDAEEILRIYVNRNPSSMVAKRMLAQVYMDDNSPVQNPSKALELIQVVYHAGGASDLTVVNMLAHAQAKAGNPEMGLNFLERLYETLGEMEAKRGLAQRISDFRFKYDLGDLWELADNYGGVIFKSTDPDEVVRALVKGVVPLDSTCRRNAVGEFTPIETTLAPLFPELTALFKRKSQRWSLGLLALAILLILGIIIALFLPGILR